MNKECVEREIKYAVKNINDYISELSGDVNKEIVIKLKEIREQIKLNNWVGNEFNLVYVGNDKNIEKICNEKFIYQYVKEDEEFYRIKIELDRDEPFTHPLKKVSENEAEEDLRVMQSRQILYV